MCVCVVVRCSCTSSRSLSYSPIQYSIVILSHRFVRLACCLFSSFKDTRFFFLSVLSSICLSIAFIGLNHALDLILLFFLFSFLFVICLFLL